MAEAGIHPIAIEPRPGLQLLVETLRDFIEIELRWILVVKIQRESCVVKLGTNPIRTTKGTRALHFPNSPSGQDLSGLVMLRECLEQLFVPEELLEHLRGHFDEIAFGGESGKAGPSGATAENRVHQMAEFMEERDHVGVLQ